MIRFQLIIPALAICLNSTLTRAQTTEPASRPAPREWVDPDTGHRIHRLSDEPNSSGFYFNLNACTPDQKTMIYSAPDGIHALDLATLQTRLVAHGQGKALMVGHKTPTVFCFNGRDRALSAVDVTTGAVRKLAELPPRASVVSINADETLAAGTMAETDDGKEYGAQRVDPKGMSGPLVQPMNKGEMMEQRLAARTPLILFTIDLKTGKMNTLLHSTDWVNHLLFSPTDPTLLMYCHEGPWQKVDRIWTIRTDGSQNQLMHKRTLTMEIAGHEWWGADGKTLWYDLQIPKGETFYVAGYDLADGKRRWFHLERNEWSIHFNVNKDETLFCGDGGDTGQVAKAPDGRWIELFHPSMLTNDGMLDSKEMIKAGKFHSEHLVNMKDHNYKLEPNVRFSPDASMVIFTSNMFGPSYVLGVETKKAQ